MQSRNLLSMCLLFLLVFQALAIGFVRASALEEKPSDLEAVSEKHPLDQRLSGESNVREKSGEQRIQARESASEDKMYRLWETSVNGDWSEEMVKIPDQNGDGYKDFVFLSSVSGNSYITILGGKNGSQIKEKVLGYEPINALFLSNHIIVAKDTGLEAFDTNLNSLYTVSDLGSVGSFQEVNGSIVLLSDRTNILCYDPSAGSLNWNHTYQYGSGYYDEILVVSDWIVAPFPNYDTETYDLDLIAKNGTRVKSYTLTDSNDANTVNLYSYETYTNPHFMLAKENDTKTMLRRYEIANNSFHAWWSTQIDTIYESVGTIHDVNDDGARDVISIWAGNLTVYNASNGSKLYITDITIDCIRETTFIGDLVNNKHREIAVNTQEGPPETYILSFGSNNCSLVCKTDWKTRNSPSPMSTIRDIDGNGFKELVQFTSPDNIYCYGWNYTGDTTDPDTYWVDAGANGSGTITYPAGNITYVLNHYNLTDCTVKVQPGTYNTSIGETFPLNITDDVNITLKATDTPTNTIINGTNAHTGIKVTTDKNTINGFTIANFGDEFDETGIYLDSSTNNMIANNTIINNTYDGIVLGQSNTTTIVNNTITTNTYGGIGLSSSNTTTITGNTITTNEYGINLDNSNTTTITGNTITTNDWYGINLDDSNTTTITGNTITNNGAGIVLSDSNTTTITGNTITNNTQEGIYLHSSSKNMIANNTIINNTYDGIVLEDGSTGNLVYRNNIIGNGVNAKDTVGGNAFNSSTIGNYWGDYNGNDVDGDGIGDTPYDIAGGGGSKDYLPAMEPFNLIIDRVDPSVSIGSPSEGATLDTGNVTVAWFGSDTGTGIDHYMIQKDAEDWIDVGMNTSYEFVDLPEGNYTITVKAIDGAGNTATDSVTFTVQTGMYIMVTTPEEDKTVHSDTVIVEWIANASVDYYQVRLDNESWSNVGTSTSYTYTSVSDGSHTVTVEIVTTNGNTATESVTFTVQTGKYVKIAFPKDEGVVNSEEVIVEWKGDASTIDHYEVRRDGGSWLDVGMETIHTFTGFSDGMHTASVRLVTDTGEIVMDVVSFTVETGTFIRITHPVGNSTTRTSNVTVYWRANASQSTINYFAIRVDGDLVADVTRIHYTLEGLEDGIHSVTVIMVCGEGNVTDSVVFGVQPLEQFAVSSNSTITGLAFNSTSKRLTFRVRGPPLTTGFVNVTVKKSLVENASAVTVKLDGKAINYTSVSTNGYWVLHFTYEHSTHNVALHLAEAMQPSEPSNGGELPLLWILMGGIIAVMVLAVVVAFWMQKKERKGERVGLREGEMSVGVAESQMGEERSRKEIEEEIMRVARTGEAKTIEEFADVLEMSKDEIRNVIEESDRIQLGG